MSCYAGSQDLKETVRNSIINKVFWKHLPSNWLVFLLDETTQPAVILPEKLIVTLNVRGKQEKFCFTALALAVLFQRFDMFIWNSPSLFKKELKSMNNGNYNVWSLFEHNNVINRFLHNISRPSSRDLMVGIMSIVYKWNSPHTNISNMLCGVKIDSRTVFKLCVETPPVWTGFNSYPMLPFTYQLVDAISEDDLLMCMQSHRVIVKDKILNFVLEMDEERDEESSWIADNVRQTLNILDHKIKPFMKALYSRIMKKDTLVKRVTPIVISLESSVIYELSYNNHTYHTIKFTSKDGKNYKVVLNEKDFKLSKSENKNLIFVPSGHFVDHPTYSDNYVSKRSFKSQDPRIRSDGILYTVKEMADIFNSGRVEPTHELLTNIKIYKRRQHSKKSLNRVLIPFMKICHLDFADLTVFSKEFQTFTQEQRYIFYILFWNIKEINLLEWVKRPGLCKFVDSFLTRLTDMNELPKMLSGLNSALWVKLRCLMEQLSPRSKAVILVMTTESLNEMITPVVDSSDDVETFSYVINLISNMNVVLQSHSKIDVCKAVSLLYSGNIPPNLRRLLYHILSTSRITCQKTTVLDPHKYNDCKYGDINVKLYMTHSEMCSETIQFDRVERKFYMLDNIYHLCNSPKIEPGRFDIVFKNEIGIGESVYEEVLKCAWDAALEDGYMTRYEDGTICLSIGADFSKYITHSFALGLVSALCIQRKFNLPYKLSEELWSYLVHDSSFFIPPRLLFSVYNTRMEQTNKLSSQEFSYMFGCSLEESVDNKRSDIIQALSVPNIELLNSFKNGWTLIKNGISLDNIDPSLLNQTFCLELETDISYIEFEKLFDRRCDKDDIFLNFVSTLSKHELLKLVEFMTGKKGLPNISMGDEKLSVFWTGNDDAVLPIAQNCINSVICSIPMVSRLRKVFRPIFRFETSFGYS